MGEKGQVVNLTDKGITVRLERNPACEKCKACMAGINKNEMLINADNQCEADKDDWVNIELKSQNFISAVFIMYGIPCIFFLVGVSVGTLLLGSEMLGFFLGIVLVALVYLVIKKNNHRFENEKYTPVATNKCDPPDRQ